MATAYRPNWQKKIGECCNYLETFTFASPTEIIGVGSPAVLTRSWPIVDLGKITHHPYQSVSAWF